MQQKELQKILDDHKLWLYGHGGERANLEDANLRGVNLRGVNLGGANLEGANLRGANLKGARGNQKEIKSILIAEEYPIVYTSKYLQIGFERHDILDWWDFCDERLLQMDGKTALKFWKKYKDFIKQAIELSPAVETRHEEKDSANL